jgi:hypothetical protein
MKNNIKKSTVTKLSLLDSFLKKNKIGIDGDDITFYDYNTGDNYGLTMAIGAVPFDNSFFCHTVREVKCREMYILRNEKFKKHERQKTVSG